MTGPDFLAVVATVATLLALAAILVAVRVAIVAGANEEALTDALNVAGTREMILRSTIAQLRADEDDEMSDIVEDLLAVGRADDEGPAPAAVPAERMRRMFDDERTR